MATDKKFNQYQTKIYGNNGIEFDRLDSQNVIASFRVRIPEDCKPMGRYIDKKDCREMFNHVFIQPSTGKLLATDSRIMAIVDVECSGQWPEDTEEIKEDVSILKRYIAPISADAICKYAGQEIDVVTYKQDGQATTLITSETAFRAISAVQLNSSINYPDWQRIWVKDCVEKIKLTKDAVKALRGWFRLNAPKKGWHVEINVSKQADNVHFEMSKQSEVYGEWEQVDELYCDIESGYPKHDIHMTFFANLFQINTLDGFNGELWFTDLHRPIKFCGEQRESILMPILGERDCFSE